MPEGFPPLTLQVSLSAKFRDHVQIYALYDVEKESRSCSSMLRFEIMLTLAPRLCVPCVHCN